MKRFRILVIPGYRIYPVDSGGAHHQLVFLAGQQEDHELEMLVTPKNIPPEQLEEFRKKFPGIKLIPTGYKNSVLSRSASFLKKQFKKLFKKGFPYRFPKIKELHNLVLRDYNLVERVKKLSRSKKYDIIQVEHSINMGLVELLPKDVIKIFVHHEISHTRIRGDLQATGYKPEEAGRFADLAKKMELTWLNKYDGIITLSKEDKELLQESGISRPVNVARPFSFFEEELEKIYDPMPQPQLVFAGSEMHFPNREGLDWFLQEIYPQVKKIKKDVRLVVTGNWTENFKKKYTGLAGIEFTGFLDDLRSVFRNGILIIPIRIGSGIRVKALTAFGYGVPVIATSLAVSGIPGLIPKENVIIADQPGLFAEAILELLGEHELRNKLSEQGFGLARMEYSNALFVKERNMFYQQLFELKNAEGKR